MRFFIAAFLMAFFSFGIGYLLPWWSISVVCFVVAFGFGLDVDDAFWGGFFAIGALWFFTALFKGNANGQLLSKKVAHLFHLNNPYLFMALAATIGGIVGGLSAWGGSLVRKLFSK
jgi:hypothetical protein